jgi:hypothetical protein
MKGKSILKADLQLKKDGQTELSNLNPSLHSQPASSSAAQSTQSRLVSQGQRSPVKDLNLNVGAAQQFQFQFNSGGSEFLRSPGAGLAAEHAPAMPVQDTQVFITLSSIDVSVDDDGAGQDGGHEGADAGFSSANAYLSNDQVIHNIPPDAV